MHARKACVPAGLQPAAGLQLAVFGRVLGVILRAVAVHAQLADERAQPRRVQLAHEFQRRVRVQGGEDRRAGGGSVQQIMREDLVIRPGMLEAGKARFLGIGVALQPVDQLQIHRRAAVAVLRGVQVQVAHAGDDQPIAAVGDGDAGKALGQRVKASGDLPVLADEKALPGAHRADFGRVDEKAPEGKGFVHANHPC